MDGKLLKEAVADLEVFYEGALKVIIYIYATYTHRRYIYINIYICMRMHIHIIYIICTYIMYVVVERIGNYANFCY